ncbi:molybdate ABC transporter substrate-binding protein [uncultured Pseudokineococcus sp.]|uniref:molybdate ABC transporter substrate-binding protein n=1 Tax=uncultured Pseudokineococcus sp. TaxID=1642928 RepID=UPI002610B8F4|nr:molybdate ABC transporter substrate-binding protein [uncultured Pseudokineococcus sp.]
MRPRTAGLRAVALSSSLLVLTACAGAGDDDGTGDAAPGLPAAEATAPGTPVPDELSGTLTVFAAASLTEVVDDLAAALEQQHPGLTVRTSHAGSSELAAQVEQGAPADVLVTADEATMQRVVDAGLVAGAPEVVATNTLTVVTPPDDPAGVGSFADLARPGTDVVVCAPQVPCGAATEQLEEATGVALHPVSEEGSVTDVLGKVTSGQADAGVVYATDARRAGDAVREVEVPEAGAAVNAYPVAVLADATEPDAAAALVALLTGAEGQRVLADAGFGPPGGP